MKLKSFRIHKANLVPFCKLLVICFLSGPAQAQTQRIDISAVSISAAIDAALAPYFKPDDPGAAVIVTKDGKAVFRKAYGLASLEPSVTLQPEMMFRIGSMTKQFTAAGIMLLADQGKLDVSDSITKVLPDYPSHGKKITIENLLTHTSGIADYYVGFAETTVQQTIDLFKNQPLEFEPGERFKYSNSGYFLLGAIIEKVSGKTYAEFVAMNIFEPLGMKQTAYEGNDRGTKRRVEGFARNRSSFTKARVNPMSQLYSAGALVSTVDDLALWDAAITAGKLLRPETWKQIFKPFKLNDGESTKYGYGWTIGQLQGHEAIKHAGGLSGFNSDACRLPKDGVYVAILSNTDSRYQSLPLMTEKVAAIAIGKPYPNFKPIKLTAKLLNAFIGEYKIDDKSSWWIFRENNQLFAQRGGWLVAMEPYSQTEFFLPEVSFETFKFVKNAKGEVTQMVVYADGAETINPRVKTR